MTVLGLPPFSLISIKHLSRPLSTWSSRSSSIWPTCGLLGCGCHYVHTVSLHHLYKFNNCNIFCIRSQMWFCFGFSRLSGNPPFYDETEEENTDLHNRIIFCRIVAGDFEFDSPYWDDISPAGTRFRHTMATNIFKEIEFNSTQWPGVSLRSLLSQPCQI